MEKEILRARTPAFPEIKEDRIYLQQLADSKKLTIGYLDDDIAIVDNPQMFAEPSKKRVSMNMIVFCTAGRLQGEMNGYPFTLSCNQMVLIPPNISFTNLMISPDYTFKAIFLTNRILRSFLREKISVWNDVLYIHHMHVLTMEADDIVFYSHFYDMLSLCINKGSDTPFQADVIQSLLRSAILALCGVLKQMLPVRSFSHDSKTTDGRFHRFLDLLNDTKVKHRTVESYAQELCISPKYLTTICKKHSGKSANEWIKEHVMEDIRYCLKQTDLSMKQIADHLGFPNPSFFGKYVKDNFGMTPTQVRRSALPAPRRVVLKEENA